MNYRMAFRIIVSMSIIGFLGGFLGGAFPDHVDFIHGLQVSGAMLAGLLIGEDG